MIPLPNKGIVMAIMLDLTPNITEFSKNALVIDNYYNHTAATYNGLLGQLASYYPDLKEYEYRNDNNGYKNYALNKMFGSVGYKTVFLDPHKKDYAYIDELMKNELGFDEVLTAEDITKKYLHEEPQFTDAINDKQLFEGLIAWLKENEGNNDKFFMGLYNLGTHAWRDSTKSEEKYETINNSALNAIYNFDFQFGKFFEYFKKSKYFENSVIVFTSDHSHYPENMYVKAFGDNEMQRIFVDRIPFIIYDGKYKYQERFDANSATSISFAPSMINYLRMPNMINSFIGSSIFDKAGREARRGLAIIANQFYIIEKGSIYNSGVMQDMAEKKSITEFVGYLRYLEKKSKIFLEK